MLPPGESNSGACFEAKSSSPPLGTAREDDSADVMTFSGAPVSDLGGQSAAGSSQTEDESTDTAGVSLQGKI